MSDLVRPITEDERQLWPTTVKVPLDIVFRDARGEIRPLVDIMMESCVLISSRKGAVRANHYHRTDWHFCYVLSGQIEYYHRPTGSEEPAERVLVEAGELFFTGPMVDHSMVFTEDTTFLTLGRNSREQAVYEADVVRIPPINPPDKVVALEHVSRRATCRLCGASDLGRVIALTPTPPANALVSEAERAERQPQFPLDVYFCRSCAHLQLLDAVDPELLFREYFYVSGTSPSFVRHFEVYAAATAEQVGLQPGDRVVDIGSNDGTLLKAYKALGADVLGVDPAANIAAAAEADGVPTRVAFFTEAVGREIADSLGQAKLVTANNVFAHIDDLADVVRGVKALLADDGAFFFECSYRLDVIQDVLFDTIYHEHLDYHALRPLQEFFARHDLVLSDAERVPTHGGSIRGVVRPAASGARPSARLEELIAAERQAGLFEERTYKAFADRIDAMRDELAPLLRRLKAEGKKIVGYGAPAKMTTLLYHFGLGPDVLDYIVDDSPLKQNRFSPGMHIPIVSAERLQADPPDYVLILAWNFAAPIIEKNTALQEGGVRFIIPSPKLEIV